MSRERLPVECQFETIVEASAAIKDQPHVSEIKGIAMQLSKLADHLFEMGETCYGNRVLEVAEALGNNR